MYFSTELGEIGYDDWAILAEDPETILERNICNQGK